MKPFRFDVIESLIRQVDSGLQLHERQPLSTSFYLLLCSSSRQMQVQSRSFCHSSSSYFFFSLFASFVNAFFCKRFFHMKCQKYISFTFRMFPSKNFRGLILTSTLLSLMFITKRSEQFYTMPTFQPIYFHQCDQFLVLCMIQSHTVLQKDTVLTIFTFVSRSSFLCINDSCNFTTATVPSCIHLFTSSLHKLFFVNSGSRKIQFYTHCISSPSQKQQYSLIYLFCSNSLSYLPSDLLVVLHEQYTMNLFITLQTNSKSGFQFI